ncbi:hypothetical protein L209DRAFT_434160 [Thermothelomyces heterothallicus CBS 203.75]
MTQTQNRHLYYQQQHPGQYQQQQHHQPPAAAAAAAAAASAFDDPALHTASPLEASKLDALDFDIDLDIDFDPAHLNYNSLSSSPISTQSLLSQYSPLSAFDSIPTPTLAEPSLSPPVRQSGLAAPESSAPPLFSNGGDAMQTDMWMSNGQITPRSVGRFSHQRDSSRSSMGSNGPASPFSQNTANPHIAMNDFGDNFHGLQGAEDLHHYQLAAKQFPGVPSDSFYPGFAHATADNSGGMTPSYPYLSTAPRRRNDRGLLPEHPIGQATSQPVSVASSVASDSPATPAVGSEEDRKHNNAAMPPMPKLDRTMTDAYADELYQPQLLNSSTAAAATATATATTTTTTATTNAGQASISPTSDLFNQRLQAANNQHLSAVTNSPVSSTSRDQSPFRHGSPLAPLPTSDFRSAMGPAQIRFNTAQQMREQTKAVRDAQAVQQHIARSADTSTPQTISPKDAMLDFQEPEGDGNFPLFPQQSNTGFNAEAINKTAAAHSQQVFGGLPMDPNAFNSFLGTSMPAAMQAPQQFPYLPQQRPQSAVPSVSNTSAATTRFGSADTGATESAHGVTPQRPADTGADGGTYTCTYHGCTLRFETPALLQKHKREGHRQAHGLNGARRPEAGGMTSSLLNTQAGPHRCDRINPSTGKPCNTVFSRPYDLTRHEHTIHNARKQKVRCDLCTDDKTFSRADALTRHYRVCHPDVEFPGKHRRRGGHSS